MTVPRGQRNSHVEAQPPATEISPWVQADRIAGRSLQWVLPGRIVRGGLTVLEGVTSSGKSTFLAHLAAAVTTGRPWLGRPKSKPASVLWLSGEEDFGSMIRPRLEAARADQSLVHAPGLDSDGEPLRHTLPGCVSALRQAVDDLYLELIVLEPLSSFLTVEADLNSVGYVRSILDPLQRMSFAAHVSIVLTRGLRKNLTGPRSSHGQGSAAIGDTCRCGLQIDVPEPGKPARSLVAWKVAGGKLPPALHYSITAGNGGPVMDHLREMSTSEALEAETVSDPGERSVRADARRMLRRMLAGGWVRSSLLTIAAADAMISLATLRRAQGELGVRTRQQWDGTTSFHEWGPPEDGFEEEGGGAPGGEHLGKRVSKGRKKAEKH